MNTGIDFEVITQHLFQDLLEQKFVKNIKVQQNVSLQGKTVKH